MTGRRWLTVAILIAGFVRKETRAEENVADAVRSLREQVNALLDHRQQDYDALEGSLKRAIEKNTELYALKNEVKQLRKELNSLRGGSGSGNEAKNERLRVRWLGSAVTELRGEVAEVLRTRNASEELAERSRMKGELELLKGDVASVEKGIRNVGGRIAKFEAVLGTIRVDIAAVKERFGQLSRTCADIASQLSAVQAEVKSLRCESPSTVSGNSVGEERSGRSEDGRSPAEEPDGGAGRRRLARRHGYSRRGEGHRSRVEDRLKMLERKISAMAQRRSSLESRVDREREERPKLTERVKRVEKTQAELSRRIANASELASSSRRIEESASSRLVGWLRGLEEAVEANDSSTKRELARLGVNAARKAAELSLTREELSNLRRAVQALSVSASKLQERSDGQEEALGRLTLTTRTGTGGAGCATSSAAASRPRSEPLEDRYHLILRNLPRSCRDEWKREDGLRLLEAERGSATLAFCRDGWIVVARRIDGTLDFDRSWNDYAVGFGSPVGEYWIGNEILHRLTRDNCSRLRVDLLDIEGERWRAEYRRFAVASEETGYRIFVDGYVGNASDALSYQNGMPFSAKDRDMDASSTHCAANYHGGWWFSRCQHANLNGKYSLGLSWFRSDTDRWMSIASAEMSVRADPTCRAR